MATRNWTGLAGDGNVATSGNWDTLPIANDSVVFALTDLTAGTYPTSGALAFALASVKISGSAPLTGVTFGSSSTIGEIVSTSTGVVEFTVSGTATRSIISNTRSLTLTAGTFTDLTMYSVKEYRILAATVVTNWYMSMCGLGTVGTNGTAITYLKCADSKADITTRNVTTGDLDGPNSEVYLRGTAIFATVGRLSNRATVYNLSSGTQAILFGFTGAKHAPLGNPSTSAAVTTIGGDASFKFLRNTGLATVAVTNDYRGGGDDDSEGGFLG